MYGDNYQPLLPVLLMVLPGRCILFACIPNSVYVGKNVCHVFSFALDWLVFFLCMRSACCYCTCPFPLSFARSRSLSFCSISPWCCECSATRASSSLSSSSTLHHDPWSIASDWPRAGFIFCGLPTSRILFPPAPAPAPSAAGLMDVGTRSTFSRVVNIMVCMYVYVCFKFLILLILLFSFVCLFFPSVLRVHRSMFCVLYAFCSCVYVCMCLYGV